MADKKKNHSLSASLKSGLVALAFLILGFQSGKLIDVIASDEVDTVPEPVESTFTEDRDTTVFDRKMGGIQYSGGKHPGDRSVKSESKRKVESFAFDPNTVSFEDLCRLGFSGKQAQAILNYREKGGHFHRKQDFARSYVVSDSVFSRLEKYIDIPLLDINIADSAAFDGLPGIGPYFASRMVSHREELGGYSYPEQLMDIHNFDRDRYDGLSDLIFVGPSEPYPLWSLPEDSLKIHPYIGTYAAHGIIVYKENTPPEEWSVMNLDKAGILKAGMAEKLAGCRLESVK